MPNFLTIDGTNYEVLTANASEEEPAVGGIAIEWSWNNTPQLTVTPERRVRSFGLGLTSIAAYEALRVIALLSPRLVGGPAMGDGAKQRIIVVTGAEYIGDYPSFLMQANITVTDAE